MPFINLAQLPQKEVFQTGKAHFIHSENMTIAYLDFEAGTVVPEHAHIHEQISTVIEGQLEFTLNGETQILEAGKIVVIPAYTPHAAKALTFCRIIDVFSPVREDFK